MGNVIIGGTATGATPLPVAGSIDATNDYLPIYTASANSTQGINRNTLLGLSSAPAGLTDNQTFTNKALTTPTISSPVLSGTVTGTYTLDGTPTFPASLVTLTDSQTLTNKVLTSPIINTPTITNATLSADAITGNTASSTGIIYGIGITTGTISSALSLTSTLSVIGATTLSNALSVGSTLNVTGNATFSGTITATTAGLLPLGGAWTSWTPTMTNFTIGTGGSAGIIAKYLQIGKTVFFKIQGILGTSGQSVGTGIQWTLPVTSATVLTAVDGGTMQHIGSGTIVDNTTTIYKAECALVDTTHAILKVTNVATYLQTNISTTTAVPMTWTINDSFYIQGSYEAA